MGRILSYRGLLADGGQDTILLSTKQGEAGYRIRSFKAFSNEPGNEESSNVLQIFKLFQTSLTGVVDFSDNRLLAAIDYRQNNNEAYGITGETIIFDQEIINQDIFITNTTAGGGTAKINYYLELEQIKLSEQEAMVATIQNIRNG